MDWLTQPYVVNVNIWGTYQSVVVSLVISMMIIVFMWFFHRSKIALYSVAIELVIALYLTVFLLLVNAGYGEVSFWLSRLMYTVFILLSLLAIHTTAYICRRDMPVVKWVGAVVSLLLLVGIYANDRWLITRDYVKGTYAMSAKGPMVLLFFIYLFFIGFTLLYQMYVIYREDRERYDVVWPFLVGMAFVAIFGNFIGILAGIQPLIKPPLYINILVFSVCMIIFLFRTMKNTLDERERMMATYLFDGLTGVYTRSYIMEEIRRRLRGRIGDTGYVAMIDLDGFKRINDQEGHLMGDRILSEFGSLLKETGQDLWIAGRTGGDEFLVYAVNGNHKEVEERLHHLMSAYTDLLTSLLEGPVDPGIGMSIGLTEVRRDEGFESMFFRADELMYVGKKAGKNSIRHDIGAVS